MPQFIAFRHHNIFKNEAIFWGDTKDGETHLVKASDLFIDNPPREIGIATFFEDLPNYYLFSKKYADLLSLNIIDELVDFAERLGAKVDKELTDSDIQTILSLWKTDTPNDTDYLKYFPEFIASGKPDLFKDQAIFWGDTKNGETKLVKACEIFIDSPLQDTSISTWYADKDNYYLLSEKYAEPHVLLDIAALVDVAKKLGAKDRLPIIQIKASRQDLYHEYYKYESSTEITKRYGNIDVDWCIAIDEGDSNGLEQWLKNPSEAKFFAIWMAMSHPNTKKEMLTACYKHYAKKYSGVRTRASRLVYALKTAAWIPQLNETDVTTFVTPAKAIPDLLPENFINDNNNGWLTAIEFGKEEDERLTALLRQEEQASLTYQAKNNKAQEMGFESAEQAAKFAELAKHGMSPDELLAQLKHAEQPEESVPNPERRRKGVLERSGNAPSKESVIRERSIQPGLGNVVTEAKAYLRAKYTNADRETVCQCCQNEMPFKIGDAYYFEAVQCVKTIENHYIENRLALCPTCAAMYQHARATDDTEICRLIIEHNAPDNVGSVEIPLTLADQPRRLRFVGTHFFDLKTVLATAE